MFSFVRKAIMKAAKSYMKTAKEMVEARESYANMDFTSSTSTAGRHDDATDAFGLAFNVAANSVKKKKKPLRGWFNNANS